MASTSQLSAALTQARNTLQCVFTTRDVIAHIHSIDPTVVHEKATYTVLVNETTAHTLIKSIEDSCRNGNTPFSGVGHCSTGSYMDIAVGTASPKNTKKRFLMINLIAKMCNQQNLVVLTFKNFQTYAPQTIEANL